MMNFQRIYEHSKIDKQYTIIKQRKGNEKEVHGTLEELTDYFGYTLLKGNSYNNKIPTKPKTIKSLIKGLNDSIYETQGSCYEQDYYYLKESDNNNTKSLPNDPG